MEKVSKNNYRPLSTLFFSFLLLAGLFFYTHPVKADNTLPPPHTLSEKLAYFIGYHNAYGGYLRGYPGPRYSARGISWTRWKNVGYGCRRSCLVNHWNGSIIRCDRYCN